MKQARQHDFFRHAGFHGQVRALQHVIRRIHESKLEKIKQRRIGGHRREPLHVFTRARHDQKTRTRPVWPRFDLRFHVRSRRVFAGLAVARILMTAALLVGDSCI